MEEAMNTISKKQKDELWELLTASQECENTPDFWTIGEVFSSGDSASEAEAAYVEINVQDFDGHHDFDFLRRALMDVGVEVNEREMLDSFDIVALDLGEEERPLKASIVTGDGEYGRLYGYQLIYTH